MFSNLRQAMLWMHSVLGLAFTGLLFVVFFMGTLALYDRELDRWMLPQTRLPMATAELSLDRQALPVVESLIAGQVLEQWFIELPSSRVPALRLQTWDMQGNGLSRYIDPNTGRVLDTTGSQGADFFYRFHYTLHLEAGRLGLLLVGLASMAGVLVVIAGLLIHVRLLKDFFSFRPDKTPRRLLDLHNLSGVFALPFFLTLLLSGLVISFPHYLPAGMLATYQEQAAELPSEARDLFNRPASGQAGSLVSLDDMAEQARTIWQGGEPAFVRVWHPGDALAYVEISRSLASSVSQDADTLYFDAPTGRLLHQATPKPAASIYGLLAGLHVTYFQQPLLRALYFLSGVSCCLVLASGLLYWAEKRRLRLPRGKAGLCMVEGLAACLITGLPLATLVMLASNRLLPENLVQRASWEPWLFFATWLAAAVHSIFIVYRSRENRAPWRSQCAAIAILALMTLLLNGITTGDYLWRSLGQSLWAVAYVDGGLLLSAWLAASTWLRMGRRKARALQYKALEDA